MLHAKWYVLHVTYDMLYTSFIIFGKQGTKSFARDFFLAYEVNGKNVIRIGEKYKISLST